MNKYQICEKNIYFKKHPGVLSEQFHAGGKAPSDVAILAEKSGYKPIYIRKICGKSLLHRIVRKCFNLDWLWLYLRVKKNSVILIQVPFRWGNLKIRNFFIKHLRSRKNVTIISFMHDIELLRRGLYQDEEAVSREEKAFNLSLEISDCIITHNSKMKAFLKSSGYEESKIIELNIFDYLTSQIAPVKAFEKKLVFAGNLCHQKSAFLAELGKLELDFDLYGINFDEKENHKRNINYCGSFLAEELPSHLNKGFGLIWDGESIETCSGSLGEYLRWNNPHKLSLYLAAGLPVFIWEEAAEAGFVKENNLGFLIKSLYDIKGIFDSLTEEDYRELVKNVSNVSEKIRNGYFTKRALAAAEKLLTTI